MTRRGTERDRAASKLGSDIFPFADDSDGNSLGLYLFSCLAEISR